MRALFDLKWVHSFLQRLAGTAKQRPRGSRVDKIYTQGPIHYTATQQAKLELLCEQLFEQKDLITTGRLQFLGLGKIKRRLGKTWPGLQKIVFLTVEEAIAKYLMPSDIFIRYKDDTYVIIFAHANAVEAQVKAALIAEEIRRQLFEHEEEALREITVEESVAVVPTRNLKQAKGLSEKMGVVLHDHEKLASQTGTIPSAAAVPVAIVPTVEIDAYAKPKAPAAAAPPPAPRPFNFDYVPMWDIKKNMLNTYLGLASDESTQGNPLDNHENLFRGISASEMTRLDLLVLKSVTDELEAMAEDGRQLYVACPVHFDTLFHGESYAQYIMACQKIPQDYKKYLIFVLLDLPASIHSANLHKFSVPLRGHCTAIYAQVPLDSKVDFAMLRDARFDAVGVRLKQMSGGEKQLLEALESFAQRSRAALIRKIFVMDVSSLSITTSAVCSGYDLLAGSAIHETVAKPDSIHRFKHENLFADLIKGNA